MQPAPGEIPQQPGIYRTPGDIRVLLLYHGCQIGILLKIKSQGLFQKLFRCPPNIVITSSFVLLYCITQKFVTSSLSKVPPKPAIP